MYYITRYTNSLCMHMNSNLSVYIVRGHTVLERTYHTKHILMYLHFECQKELIQVKDARIRTREFVYRQSLVVMYLSGIVGIKLHGQIPSSEVERESKERTSFRPILSL